eukprot:g5497.t1
MTGADTGISSHVGAATIEVVKDALEFTADSARGLYVHPGIKRKQPTAVVVSGTHGVKAPLGLLIQARLWRNKPPGVNLVLVAQLNPEKDKRFNAKNVDLNRNVLAPEDFAKLRVQPERGVWDTLRLLRNESGGNPTLFGKLAWRNAVAEQIGAGKAGGKTAAWHARTYTRVLAGGSAWERASAEAARTCLTQRVRLGQVVLVAYPTGLGTSAVWPAALRGNSEMAGPGALQSGAAWPLRSGAMFLGPPAAEIVLVAGAVVGGGASGTAGLTPSEWGGGDIRAAVEARARALGATLGSATQPPFEAPQSTYFSFN